MSTDLPGTWDVVVATPFGDQNLRLAIEVDGTEVSGTATHSAGTYPFSGGRITSKGAAELVVSLTAPVTADLKIKLTASGDTLSGSARTMLLPPFKVSGTRVTGTGVR